MSRTVRIRVSIAAAVGMFTLLSSTGAAAQSRTSVRASNWELNLHAAAMRPSLFDETTQALQLGGRIFRNFGNGLAVGGNVDWAKADDVTLAPFAGLGASLFLYSAELGYGFPISPRSTLYVGAGVGAATVSLDDAPVGATASSTGLLIPAGGGLKFQNRALSPSWALRLDLRDNVILLETLGTEGETETEPRHNVEASVGVSFLFGGESEDVAARRDSDRDGVPDVDDFCLNRAGEQVDGRGCPVAGAAADADRDGVAELEAPDDLDADADGVSDFSDGCLGTPAGVPVGVDGCPLPSEAGVEVGAGVEARAADEDGDGVTDDVDACPGTPAGIPTDDRGCLARAEAPPDDAGIEDEPLAAPLPPDAGVAEPVGEAACLDPAAGTRVIEFEGRRFEPAGFPQPVDRRFLIHVGSFEGIPIYVSDTAQQPYGDFWVPRCGDDGTYELYVEVGALP